jgi:hypothetical protein
MTIVILAETLGNAGPACASPDFCGMVGVAREELAGAHVGR